MLGQRHRMIVERLETRQMLSSVGWFEDSGQQPGENTFAIAVGDLDSDGDLDIFSGCWNHPRSPRCEENTVWLNDAEGNFSAGWSGPTGAGLAVALGDLDADGDLDAFVGNGAAPPQSPNTFPNEVWLNDGLGNFHDSGQRLGRAGTWDVRLGDLDGDGDLDAVVANAVGPNKVWLNDGQANFTDTGQSLRSGALVVALGDIDGDGDLDVYSGHYSSADRVWLNDGQGNFTDSQQRLTRRHVNGAQLGDLDGDGDLDVFLAMSNSGHPNEVWLNDGSGIFTDSGQQLGRLFSRWVELGDLDRDGDLDAFVVNGAPFAGRPEPAQVWLNDGLGMFENSGQRIDVKGANNVALGDLDGDGDLDAAIGRLSRENEIWMNVTPAVVGDSNQDGQFDQADIVKVLQGGKYNTGQPADRTEGDWNGDGFFDQFDVVAALQAGTYLHPLSAV